MNFIDIIILIPLIYAAWKGFSKGFIIEVFTLLALFVGLYAGIHFSDYTANWLKETFEWNSPYLPTVSFTLTFLAVGAMVYFAGKMIEQVVRVVQLSLVNKFFGMLFGLIKMLYIVSVFLILIESYDEKSDFFPETTKENSLLYKPVVNFSVLTIPALKESTMFIKNTFESQSDSTELSVNQIIRAKEIADSLGIDANDALELKKVYDEHER